MFRLKSKLFYICTYSYILLTLTNRLKLAIKSEQVKHHNSQGS